MTDHFTRARSRAGRLGAARQRPRVRSGALLGALLGAVLGAPVRAEANDGAFYGKGATVFPVQQTAVTMEEEILDIAQAGPYGGYISRWEVSVKYRFHNTSDQPVTVQMGFPEACERTPDDDYAEEETGKQPKCRPTIFDFVAEVDGKRLPVTVKRADPKRTGPLADEHFDRVHTFEVRFAPGQRRAVHHRYRNGVSITSPYTSHLDYILRTGGLWKGPIGSLTVTLTLLDRFEEVQAYPAEPGPDRFPDPTEKRTEGGKTIWVWRLKDHVPTANLSWSFGVPITHQGRELLHAEKLRYEETPAALEALDAEALRRLRNLPYAVQGHTFKNAGLASHFAQYPWYLPRPDFDPKWLSADDLKFIKKIKEVEARRPKGAAPAAQPASAP